MTRTTDGRGSAVMFQGKSGTRYHFQAWPMDTKFKAAAGIYIVTKREYLNRTYPTMAAHRCLAIGQTADLAASVLSKAELKKLEDRGANCICVYAVADEATRLRIEQDLIEGNEQWGGELYYLFRPTVGDRAPDASELS